MARMHPAAFQHDLAKKPKLAGEKLVFGALAAALDDGWQVFYDRAVRGTRRRIDFLALHAERGALAIEVKGGLVHDRRGAFRQLISRSGQRRRIDPFGQLKLAIRDVWKAAGLPADALPLHQAIWFPEMGQGGLRWQPSPHIWTREQLEPGILRELVETALPVIGGVVVGGLMRRLAQVVTDTHADAFGAP